MLGFSPLAADPLASVSVSFIVATPTELGGTTSLTFTVEGSGGAYYLTGGASSLTFGPTTTLFVNAHTGGTTGLTFTPTADLRLAGNPINFDMTVMPLCFDVDGPVEFNAHAYELVFLGVKQ
ncbi:hypothetical protein [Tsuneonella sp. HG222]